MEWTEDLAVGVSTIDSQHKELFKRIGKLVAAIKEHRCKEEVDGTILFLEDYARFHFAEEEKRMQEAGYEGLAEHRKHHAVYLKNIGDLKGQATLPRIHGMSYELSVTVNQVVVDWIVDHIMKIDKKFGSFLKNKTR
jgi:hemerythrin